jgi:drug/metabolite transporter (DMT)-like permease
VRAYDWARLLGLASLWSLQYLFLRICVPVFGAGAVADGRALLGALFLIPAALALGQRIALREHWRDYLVISVYNNVLPFLCIAWAAGVLPASYLSVISGTVPLWAGVFAAWMLKEPLHARQIAGFVVGLAGVALIVNLGPVAIDARSLLGVAAALAGTAMWGWGGVVIKRRSAHLPPIGLAAGSIIVGAIVMLPLWAGAAPPATWTFEAAMALAALGFLGTGLAYLAFFTLVRDIGPSRTLTTGLIIPALGVLWGWLFLDEAVTLAMLAGVALVISALLLVLRR